jgi:hypothetical protein
MFTRICALVGLILLSVEVPHGTQARESAQYEDASEHIKGWFKSLKSPKGAVPCCDEADGHRTEYVVRGNTYWVPIQGRWHPIPLDIVIRNSGNPTGEGVVFYYLMWDYESGGEGPVIFCFVPSDTN